MMGAEQLGRLIDTHSRALVLYARQLCRAPEDVVQEAFIKLSTQQALPQAVVPWLYRVVRNGALSASRAERRRQHHETVAAERTTAWFTPSADDSLDPTAAAEALRLLPLEQREVIVAHVWGCLTFQEIAEVTNSSASTAYRLYAAALAALRERLQQPCPASLTQN